MNFEWNLRWYEEENAYSGFFRNLAELIAPMLQEYSSLCDIGCGLLPFREGQPPEVLSERFDRYGVQLIRSAKADLDSTLILMDECGSLESRALVFHRA